MLRSSPLSDEDTIIVRLTWPEMCQAAFAGVMRQVSAVQHRRRPKHGMKRNQAWSAHCDGCCGEMAFAKWIGMFWSIGVVGGGDVGSFEVRTRSEHWHDLIIQDDDKPQAIFVLVTWEKFGEYHLRGWILGADGMDPAYRLDPAGGREAFFVPQTALRPMRTLQRWVGTVGSVAAEIEERADA